eukprot:762797-Lingulodinium_polyedra.AAC.1
MAVQPGQGHRVPPRRVRPGEVVCAAVPPRAFGAPAGGGLEGLPFAPLHLFGFLGHHDDRHAIRLALIRS